MKKETNETQVEPGANVYLGLNARSVSDKVVELSFGVTITNLNKEDRFFNAPFFKLSVILENKDSEFRLTNTVHKTVFPKKTEYREVIGEKYLLNTSFINVFEKAIAIDPNATIVAITSTTIGQTYESNEYKISQLLESFKYAK